MHDSHIHISLSPLKENITDDIQEFLDNGGKKILIQTTEIDDYQDSIILLLSLKDKFPNILDLALGIHPSRIEEGVSKNSLENTDVFKFAKKQLDIFETEFIKNKKIISAIGECGLDYYSMNEYFQFTKQQKEEIKEAQRRVFTKLCSIAVSNNLPMSIHARGESGDGSCVKDTLDIIAKEGKGILKGSFHSYTGDKKFLEKILNLGMYIGFNAIITYPSGENVRDILKATPLDRVLFETDGPFLPTQSVRKKKNSHKKYGRPVLIKEIIEKASEIKNEPYEKVEAITDNNYITLFSK